MSTNIAPFRVTPEDLPDLDKKTAQGLTPLLAALNVTMQQLVAAFARSSEQYVPVSLQVGAVVADSFPLVFRHALPRVSSVELINVQPIDVNHVLTAPWVMQGWTLTDGGLVSVPYVTGLLASNSYNLTFLVKA